MIYFVYSKRTDLIKIGRTGNFIARFQQLQGSYGRDLEILKLVEECFSNDLTEDKIHARFIGIRDYGEWFKNCQELRSFIDDLDGQPIEEINIYIRIARDYRLKLNKIIDRWQKQTGLELSQKSVLEYLIDLAYEGEITPTVEEK